MRLINIKNLIAIIEVLRVNALEAVKPYDWNVIAENSIQKYSQFLSKK